VTLQKFDTKNEPEREKSMKTNTTLHHI